MDYNSIGIKIVGDIINFCSKEYAGRPMLVVGAPGQRQEVTFDEFYNKVRKYAFSFHEAGYTGGKRVAVLGENCEGGS